jgi:hypothetical protein
MPVRNIIRFAGDCDCPGHREHEYRVLGWNDVGKPAVRCTDCQTTTVGPLGAARVERAGSHRQARMAADGGHPPDAE